MSVSSIFESRSWKIAFLISSFSEAASITICTSRIGPGFARRDNARAAFLRLLVAHQAALDRFAVGFLDPGQAAIEHLDADVAQDDRHAARAEPLRDARAHHARADDGGVHDFLGRRLVRSFAVTVGEEEIANQVAGRFRFAQLDDGVELAGERLVDRTR